MEKTPDQLQGYISPNEPFPEWEFYEDFRSLKKADQWLLGWIYYGSAKFLNYLQSFFYQTTNFIETVYNYILFALLFSPLAALAFFFPNSNGFLAFFCYWLFNSWLSNWQCFNIYLFFFLMENT